MAKHVKVENECANIVSPRLLRSFFRSHHARDPTPSLLSSTVSSGGLISLRSVSYGLTKLSSTAGLLLLLSLVLLALLNRSVMPRNLPVNGPSMVLLPRLCTLDISDFAVKG